ncbi:hypothetical protein JR316_0010022 [Psilocybe cubensis]|uniref:Uncharacterized protein n=2 Tax=Psilocybe cubensis TaxID=181762 RepID=A0ACB8GQG0_PSICU|nr:hypothetical protein JR316_0010022 [Psilocybe cubensis]KAH9477793.1 hypothetical protein JR316_0010022 [Psilocybe cubensis]
MPPRLSISASPNLPPNPAPPRYINKTQNEIIASMTSGKPLIHYHPAPAGGHPPIVRVPNNKSVWDESLWNTSEVSDAQRGTKGECQKKFCLDDKDMLDLCWIDGPVNIYGRASHMYLLVEVERRAWEKYGGPQGLKAHRKLPIPERKAAKLMARKLHKELQLAVPSAVAEAGQPNSPTNQQTARRRAHRRRFSDASVDYVEIISQRNVPGPSSSPISAVNTSSPASAPYTSPPDTPGPSTPVRTPKSNRHVRKPYNTPIRRGGHQSSCSPIKSDSRRVEIDLTIEPEDDVFSRFHTEQDIIEISD